MNSKQKNLDIVDRFWAAVAARNIESYAALFTSDAVAHDPANGPALRTDEERRAYMLRLFDNFVKLDVVVNFITPCGDFTASKWTAKGISPDGAEVSIEGIDVIRHAAGGLIEEMWGYFDN